MSPLIFHTDKDDSRDHEIAGVGRLAGNARGGVPVERAARAMQELQDDDGQPLTGAKLEKAAEEWAEARGLRTKSLKNVDEEKLRLAAGALPSGPTIEEVSRAASERDFGAQAAHAEEPAASPLSLADLPPQHNEIVEVPEGEAPPDQPAATPRRAQ